MKLKTTDLESVLSCLLHKIDIENHLKTITRKYTIPSLSIEVFSSLYMHSLLYAFLTEQFLIAFRVLAHVQFFLYCIVSIFHQKKNSPYYHDWYGTWCFISLILMILTSIVVEQKQKKKIFFETNPFEHFADACWKEQLLLLMDFRCPIIP